MCANYAEEQSHLIQESYLDTSPVSVIYNYPPQSNYNYP